MQTAAGPKLLYTAAQMTSGWAGRELLNQKGGKTCGQNQTFTAKCG